MGNIEKFDCIANLYDTPERTEAAKIIAYTIRLYIINGADKTAIDYGCGTGLVGLQLLDDFKSILFIDASRNMIEQVNQKLSQLPACTANTLCRDLVKEYPEGLYADYIIMVQTLLHVKEVELILSRLYSVLNDGGHLLIVDFDKNNEVVSDEVHNGFKQNELIDSLKKAGFIRFKARTFFQGEKMFMNKAASLFIIDAEK